MTSSALATRGAPRDALRGGLAVALGVVVAVAFKARCGLPGSVDGQYRHWCYSDIGPLWFAERLDEGAAPYLEHAVEYPPLTGLWMWLAAWPADDLPSFFWWTAALLVVAGAVTGALLGAELGARGALVVALAPTLWLGGALNWDLPAVALATAGLVAHRRGRDGWAGIALGLGTAAKLWPVLALPPVALAAWRRRGPTPALAVLGGAAGAWLAVNLPVISVAPDGWYRFVELSRSRGADWDSLWRIVGGWLDWTPTVPILNVLVGVGTVAGTAALVAWTVRRDAPCGWHLVALPVVAWFLLVGKVWSPQHSLWLLPLLALARAPVAALVAFGLADAAVATTRFPYIGGAAGLADPWPAWPFETAVVVRAVVVAVVAVHAWRRAVTPAATGDPPRPSTREPAAPQPAARPSRSSQ